MQTSEQIVKTFINRRKTAIDKSTRAIDAENERHRNALIAISNQLQKRLMKANERLRAAYKREK